MAVYCFYVHTFLNLSHLGLTFEGMEMQDRNQIAIKNKIKHSSVNIFFKPPFNISEYLVIF